MKQLLLIAALALSLVSCAVKNTYKVVSTDQPHNYSTMVQTTANWDVSQQVEINGHSFVVVGVQDFEIVSK